MTEASPLVIQSRDNALVKDLRRLSQDSTAYRKQQRVWLEGDHLCSAALVRGVQPQIGVFSESFWAMAPSDLKRAAPKNVLLSDAVWKDISGLESPAHIGFVMELPQVTELDLNAPTVVLDRLQDAGNVGSILRSASAFGFTQIAAIKGTAALWSAKVLRAGMGAHFALRLVEGLAEDDVAALQVPLLATSSHLGDFLHKASLPWPCAWLMGHEGQGVSQSLQDKASAHIRIAQPGGEESLNVAVAAAICLHASGAARS
mgnify:FL=1